MPRLTCRPRRWKRGVLASETDKLFIAKGKIGEKK